MRDDRKRAPAGDIVVDWQFGLVHLVTCLARGNRSLLQRRLRELAYVSNGFGKNAAFSS
jgi:hypothetical protein